MDEHIPHESTLNEDGDEVMEAWTTDQLDGLEQARRAVNLLSASMKKTNDKRRFGVNCVWWLLDGMIEGHSTTDAIQRVLRQPTGSEQ